MIKDSRMDKRITIVKDVIVNPSLAFREINQESKFYLSGAIALFLISAGLFSQGIVEGIISMIADIGIIILILYVGRLLKGKAVFTGIFSVLQYSGIPALIGSGILLALPENIFESGFDIQTVDLSTFFSLIGISMMFFIWSFILSILAIKEAHQFGVGKSLATIIISSIIFLLVIIVPVIISLGLLGGI